MAKFVLSGRVDSTEYSRAEMLGELLCTNLTNFKLHKIPIEAPEWPSWLSEACLERGWQFEGPILIWRELIDRGGKGLVLGGLKDFEEYAKHYYNITLDTPEDKFSQIVLENSLELERKQEEEKRKSRHFPTVVCITNASSPLAYNLVQQLSCSGLFSDEGGVEFRLLGSANDAEVIEGVCMEIDDLALPHVRSARACSSTKEAFSNVQVVFLLDHHSVTHDSDNKDSESQLKDAVVTYHNYARILDFRGDKSVKVIVSGQYADIGVAIFASTAASLESGNIVAPTNLASQQVKSILAMKLNINSSNIHNVAMWGSSYKSSLYADLSRTEVHNYAGSILGPPWYSRSVKECILDHDWLEKDFRSLLKEREGGVGYREGGPVVSEAVALTQFLKQWVEGTESGLSAAMYVTESCSLCPSILPVKSVVSLPCVVREGELSVSDCVAGISEDLKEKLTHSVELLHKDLEIAYEIMEKNTPCSP